MIEIDDLDWNWLKTDMVAAIEPMDDRGYEIASEAHKLPMGKVLDVFCRSLRDFAVLKPSAQVKPKGPPGCKMVGTVKGTKLWAGDCVASEPTGSAPPPEGEK